MCICICMVCMHVCTHMHCYVYVGTHSINQKFISFNLKMLICNSLSFIGFLMLMEMPNEVA